MPNLDITNARVRAKVDQAVARMKALQSSLGMQHGQNKDDSSKLTQIRTRITERDGVAERVRFRFKRSGVFVHMGVGQGTPKSRVGSTKRRPKEWFNPVIQQLADELADDVFDAYVDVKIDKLLIPNT